MFTYLATGIIVSLVLFIIRWRRRSSAVVLTTLLVLAIAVTIALILLPIRKGLGGEAWYQIEPHCWIFLYIVMLLGMAVSVITKAIDERKAKLARCTSNEEKKQIKLIIDFYDLLYPFLISFITFGYVYSQIEEKQIALMSFILAFQTGFFWESIVNTMKSKYEKAE